MDAAAGRHCAAVAAACCACFLASLPGHFTNCSTHDWPAHSYCCTASRHGCADSCSCSLIEQYVAMYPGSIVFQVSVVLVASYQQAALHQAGWSTLLWCSAWPGIAHCCSNVIERLLCYCQAGAAAAASHRGQPRLQQTCAQICTMCGSSLADSHSPMLCRLIQAALRKNLQDC